MRVLHVHEHLASRGGIETYLLALMPRLGELGHAQAIAYGDGDAKLWDRSFRIESLLEAGRRAERDGISQMQRVTSEFRPDVIHLHNVHNVGAVDACLEASPTVVTTHDYRYACPASNFYHRRTRSICDRTCGVGCFATTLHRHCLTPRPRYALRYYRRVRWMARNWGRFAGLIAPSASAQERFIQAGFPVARSVVLPYFCPIEPLAEPRPAPSDATITFLGRLTPIKGYEDFIRALGRLPQAVRGLMVGDLTPEKKQRLRRFASEAGCQDRLVFRSWARRDEIEALMRQTTVFCFPSRWPETLGIVGLEALACGVPVVAYDVGGVREWLHPNVTGLLVERHEPEALAAAVQALLDSPERARAMGAAGQQMIRSQFDPRSHVSRLAATYEAVIKSPVARN